MRRLALGFAVLLATAAVAIVAAGAGKASDATGTYKIQLDNAFGLVDGADFKVAGVRAGTITSIKLDQTSLLAIVTVNVTQGGFGAFHADAFCQSRPQSLIGEYFIDCQPGQRGPVLAAREHDPGHPHAVDDPRRPAAERAEAPLPATDGADHQRARRGRGGSLRRHRGGAAACGAGDHADRQPAPPAGQRLAHIAAADRQRRHPDDRASEQRPSGAALHHRRRTQPRPSPPASTRACRRRCGCSPGSWRSYSPR